MKMDLDQRNKLREIDSKIQQKETEEQLKLFSDNAAREIKNERDYKNKFERFNDKEAKHREQYKNAVMSPEQNKQFEKLNWINKNA